MTTDTPFLNAKSHLDDAAGWLEDVGPDRQEPSLEESLEGARDELRAAMRPLWEVGYEQQDRGVDPIHGHPVCETVVIYPRAAEARESLDAIYKAFDALAADDVPVRTELAVQVRNLIPGLFAAELAGDKALDEHNRDSCPF